MEWWSWILASIGMTGVYLTTKKLIAGFIVGVSVQALWISYAVVTHQYGFIFSAIGYGFVNLLGIIRWRRDSTKKVTNDAHSDDS